MPSITFGQAKALCAPFITSQGASDSIVGTAINFVNERFISSGQWKGNRFIRSFTVSQDSNGNNYFDTVPGVESVLKVIAIDPDYLQGEIGDIMADWFPFDEGGLGWLPANYAGDLQIVRQGNVPASPLPSGNTADTQRYRVLGKVPENRQMYCIVRRGYVPLVNDTDLLVPSNRNAYRYGTQAFNYESANELERAQVYWDYAFKCLNDETASFEDGEIAQIQIQTKAFAPGIMQNLV
ncbi:hypothetical protein EBR03_04345 [bacterium]|nr:hypothetical protein [bacterium]